MISNGAVIMLINCTYECHVKPLLFSQNLNKILYKLLTNPQHCYHFLNFFSASGALVHVVSLHSLCKLV